MRTVRMKHLTMYAQIVHATSYKTCAQVLQFRFCVTLTVEVKTVPDQVS